MAMASGLKPVALFTLITLHFSSNLDQTTLVKKKIYYMAKRTFLSLDQRGKSACTRKVYLAHLDIVNQYTRFA